MAEYSRHDPANSNTVTQQEYEDMNAPHQPSGVIGTYGDTPIVYADGSGRIVKVRANKKAKVRGRTWYNDAAEFQVTIAANASGSTRIDTIVLRLSRSTWQVRVAVVQGTPGAGAPALTQQTASGNTVWEMPLADVTVISGAAVINAGNVTSREWYVVGDVLVSSSTVTPPVGFPLGTRWLHADTGLMHQFNGAAWRVVEYRFTQTLAASQPTITIPDIPSYLRRLRLYVTSRADSARVGQWLYLRINGDSGATNYRSAYMSGGGNATLIDTPQMMVGFMPGAQVAAGIFGSTVIDIVGWDSPHAGFLGVTHQGQVVQDATNSFVSTGGAHYKPAGPYTSLTLLPELGSFVAGTRVTVEGTP